MFFSVGCADCINAGWIYTPKDDFADMWNTVIGSRYSWSMNPFVWVVDFEKIEKMR